MLARLTLTVVAALVWSGVATADIIDTTGDAVELGSAPASVNPPGGEEDGTIHAFAEQSGVALTADLTADMTVHYTTYNPPADGPWLPADTGRTLGTIPMGTIVNSYYIHFDPETIGGVIGAVTFDEPILAVIAEGDTTMDTFLNDPPGDTLGQSNYLGNLGTTYPVGGDLMGIEDGPDRVRLYESTVEVAFGAANPGDRVRVLTIPGGTVLCGNSALDAGEGCDDGNIAAGDGCFGCQPEVCSACTGTGPLSCTPIVSCSNGDGCCAPGCTPATDTDCLASCTQKKIKCTLKKKSCLLKLFQKSASKGVPVDVTRAVRCGGQFELCFFKAELKGGCQTTDDAPAIEAKVDSFLADVVSELDVAPADDLNKCRKSKLQCVDKYDQCILKLYVKATKTGTIDPTREAKCALKLTDCFGKAESKGGCETTGDSAAIQAKDDAFITDATCELQVCIP